MDYAEKAVELGYEVGLAFEGQNESGPYKAWNVKGFGVETIYSDSDESAWKFLVNPDAHDHRVKMEKHNDPDDEFKMTDDEVFESSMKASLSAGLIDEKELKQMRENREASKVASST